MKVILYMATTANGYIAKLDNETPWSDEEWKSFAQKVREVKNIVMGRKTYEIMKEYGELDKIGNPFAVVVSSKKENNPHITQVHSPHEALQVLKEKGFEQTLVAGGGKLNASFREAGLIDEVYLDIEPILFGNGIKLFSESEFEVKLEFLSSKKISKNTIQLHYKVVK